MNVTPGLLEQIDKVDETYTWREMDRLLYAFFDSHPGHRRDPDKDFVFAKVAMVNRCYKAGIQRRTPYAETKVAQLLTNIDYLDPGIQTLREMSRFDQASCAEVVALHGRLVQEAEAVCKVRLESFFSKYLHFHCPAVTPIYDRLSWNTLKSLVPKGRGMKEGAEHRYQAFCACFLDLYRTVTEDHHRATTVRILDLVLYLPSQDNGWRKAQGRVPFWQRPAEGRWLRSSNLALVCEDTGSWDEAVCMNTGSYPVMKGALERSRR